MSENPLLELDGAGDAPVSVSTGISALAMNFAMKWFDMRTIKDGVLYQQKKMEGTNFEYYGMPELFHVARQFEDWIVKAPNRLSTIVWDEVLDVIEHLPIGDAPVQGTDE